MLVPPSIQNSHTPKPGVFMNNLAQIKYNHNKSSFMPFCAASMFLSACICLNDYFASISILTPFRQIRTRLYDLLKFQLPFVYFFEFP